MKRILLLVYILTGFISWTYSQSLDKRELYFNGKLESKNGNYEQALKSFFEVISIDSNYHYAFTEIGICYYELGKYNEAIKYYNKALQIDSSIVNYFLPANKAEAYNSLHMYERAIFECNKSLSFYDTCTTSLINRGIAYDKLKQYEKALSDFNKVISINPNYEKAYNNIGLVLYHQNKYDEAIRYYDKAISLLPIYPKAYHYKGLTLLKMENWKDAKTCFTKAIEFDKNYPEPYLVRGMIYLDIMGDKDKGCKDVYRAYELGKIEALEYINEYCKK